MSCIRLYRAVSLEELQDLRLCGFFRVIPNANQGKHFAMSVADATCWGERFHGKHVFAVVEAEIEESSWAHWMRWGKLDGVGPACFADVEQLDAAALTGVCYEPPG